MDSNTSNIQSTSKPEDIKTPNTSEILPNSNINTNNTESIKNNIVLPEVLEKEEQIKKRKRRFNLVIYSILGSIAFIILIGLILVVVRYIQERTKKSFETTTEVKTENNIDISKTWITYASDKLRLNIKYPDNAKVIENKSYNASIRNVEILYTPQNKETTTGETLSEGFIFRITPLNLTKDTLDEIASVKRESFYAECGEGVQMSAVRSDLIFNLDARTFDVRNCEGDFKVTYTKRFGLYYEIIQLYRGDLGFRQQYKSTTEEMIKSLSFYDEDVIEEPPFKKFESIGINLAFEYPKELIENCCDLPEPTSNRNIKEIIVLGAKESNTKYGVFGVYTITNDTNANKNKGYSFEEFINMEKENLISDYKIANNGNEPTIVQETMNIGGKYALRFKGLSWKGNDLIYIANPDKNGKITRFYAISLVNTIGPEFENMFQDILDTFSFEDI